MTYNIGNLKQSIKKNAYNLDETVNEKYRNQKIGDETQPGKQSTECSSPEESKAKPEQLSMDDYNQNLEYSTVDNQLFTVW